MEQADFAEITRVVAQYDTFADIGGEDRVDIAHALETHAIGLNFSRLGHRQEEQVKLLQGFRHARDKAACCQRSCGGILVSPCGRAWYSR